MLTSPVTTETQVDAFLATFDSALTEFSPLMRAG
jgi:hypothetical protein